MQVLGGSPSKGAAAGQSGVIDPLMAGFSADAVAAAAGEAGSGTPENQFAGEFAAALAALEAQQAASAAQSLAEQALLDGQAAADAAQLIANGQNLPFDPAFQNAVLATFAAVNGAVQADADNAAALAATQLAVDASAQAVADPAALLASAQAGANPSANLDAESSAGSSGAQDLGVVDPAAQLALLAESAEALAAADAAPKSQALTEDASAQIGQDNDSSTTNNQATVTPVVVPASQAVSAAVVTPDAVGTKSAATPSVQAMGAASQARVTDGSLTDANANTADNATNAAVAGDGAIKVSTRVQSQSGGFDASTDDSSQQQSSQSSAQDAAASRHRPESADAAKETVQAGNLANDIGNVLVTAKANAEGVAAAADTARQSAQRVDATSGVVAAQSAEAARAESKLEATRASLGSGPLNVEVLKLTKQGGGRAVLEVTPPNQGPIRLDLQLDGAGRATLVVEGLTEAMKARLESSSHFLRQDMAQMGLALNLEMRERNDSNPAAQAFDQGQSGQSGGKGGRDGADGKSASVATASGNASRRSGPISADDGIHLVA